MPNLHSSTEHSPTASSWFMVPGLSLFPLRFAPSSPTQTALACPRASLPTWAHPVQTGRAQAPSWLEPGPLHVLFLPGPSSSFSNWSDKIWVSNVCFMWACRGSKLWSSFGEQHIRLSKWKERRCFLFDAQTPPLLTLHPCSSLLSSWLEAGCPSAENSPY